MSFETEFLDLMPSTITVRALDGVDDYAEPIYSTGTSSYRCLVQEKPTLVRNTMGEEVTAAAVAYVAAQTRLSATSQYTLPDGAQPSVLNIDIYYDQDGIHHNVVYFGSGAHA